MRELHIAVPANDAAFETGDVLQHTIRHCFPIFIVDPDWRRRAGIAHSIQEGRMIVAYPFESYEELPDVEPAEGLVLIADVHGLVGEVATHLRTAGWSLPFIAYGPADGPHRVVEAMRRGACDYIEWPGSADALLHSIERAAAAGSQGQSIPQVADNHSLRLRKLTNREDQVANAMTGGLSIDEVARLLNISSKTVQVHLASIRRKSIASPSSPGLRAGAGSTNLLPGSGLSAPDALLAGNPRLASLSRRERQVLAHVTAGLSNKQIAQRLNISPKTVETHRANLLVKLGARNTVDAVRMAIDGGLA